MAPVAPRVKIAQWQLSYLAGLYPGHGRCYFACHKLKPASWPLVVEENSAGCKHSVGFTIVAGELKPRNLTNAVRRARVKRRLLVLGSLANLAKHFGGTGEIKTALWLQFTQRGKHIVCPVDICIHRRESVRKTFGNKRLSGQMVTFVKLVAAHNRKQRRITFGTRSVQLNAVQQMTNAREAPIRVFQRDAADETVHVVSQ